VVAARKSKHALINDIMRCVLRMETEQEKRMGCDKAKEDRSEEAGISEEMRTAGRVRTRK
jgi:hypothetical protein